MLWRRCLYLLQLSAKSLLKQPNMSGVGVNGLPQFGLTVAGGPGGGPSSTNTWFGDGLGNETSLKLEDLAIVTEEKVEAPPHNGCIPEALFYTLPYLGLKELLILELVSKQLRDAVRGDVLLWQQLHVNAPLNKKFTNDALLRLASRGQGRLRSVSLVKCVKITDDGIETVLASNPMLQKLSLPGCTGVSIDSILRMVKMQTQDRSPDMPGLKQLQIRGLYGVTREILDNLQTMLQPEGDPESQSTDCSPQFYKNNDISPACDEERVIDIEACPKCGNARVVFDCTRETCQQRKSVLLQQCRGCYLCIARCVECGTCINGEEYEETFCLDLLCLDCWQRLPKCLECNRAGCTQHADNLQSSDRVSFTCAVCQGILPGEGGTEF